MKHISILKHSLLRAAMTLALMMTCAMAWADNDPVSYIDADGTTQTCTDYTVLTGNESSIGTSDQTKWYVVNSDISYSSSFVCYGNVNIILADDKTMTVNGNTININAFDLTIYGQSGQSGSLNVPNPPSNASGAIYCNQGSFIINGGTVNAHGEQNAIFCDHGNFIINRGTVNATGNSTSGIGIRAKYVTINGGNVTTNAKYGIKIDYSEGNITINGGNVTANGTWGIYANYIDITLGWSNASDRIYASQYFVSDGHTINIAEGKYFKDDNGNCYFGTVRANDIDDKTLQPASQTEYIQYRLGTASDVTITNCLYAPAALEEGETWVGTTGSATFARNGGTFTNCYYTTDFNNGNDYTGQGKRAHSIKTGENVTVENAGTPTTYDVSGITSYGTGILYDNVLYAGNGDAVSLTLGNTLPATYNFFGYIVDHGNLSGNDTEGYTLDMPDEDVIITADFCADITNLHIVGEIGNHSVTVGWDNGAGDMFEYAMVAGHNIDLTTVTYEGTTTASENTWNNLNLDSDYTVVLRRQCSTDHYSQALALEIHTDVACPAPYRLAATNSTATTATLNWSGVQDSYNVRYSPCFLAEGFESGTMPDGWTRTGSYWQITSGTGIGIGIDFSDWNGAATGNYNAGCYIEEHNVSDTLITPVMDLGNIASATLYFSFWNTDWDEDINTLNVYYRVDGGEWHLLYTNSDATEGWIPVTINLKGLAANYQIGFECISHWNHGMGIDDVMVISAWMTKNNVNPFTLTVDERPIGGLGVFLVRNLMDSINYERTDGKNVLRMEKRFA